MNRRRFLNGVLAAPSVTLLETAGLAASLEVIRSFGDETAAGEMAHNEDYWAAVQRAFAVDRSVVNLNNGGVSPAVAASLESLKRHLEFSNQVPAYNMWRILEPRKETVRSGVARIFGCDPEEVALTRNASEGLEICQFGFDLEPGDEVVTTNQDYPRMVNTWKQEEKRHGIVLKQFSIPVPAEDEHEIVALFEEQITPRTKLILMCHVINLTGQILPVRRVVQMARRHGVPVIVDGAHSLAHFPFSRDELDCDYFAASLHKWLCAPHGTGMLYVRRDKIHGLWPLMAASETQDDDIRKFEEIGTHPAAQMLATADALLFHDALGADRKAARLRYLRDYWAGRLLENDRVTLNTSLDPRFSCGIATVRLEGIDSGTLSGYLWREHRVLVTTIKHPEFEGIRVSPSFYTTLEELDRFCEAIEGVLEEGLSA